MLFYGSRLGIIARRY